MKLDENIMTCIVKIYDPKIRRHTNLRFDHSELINAWLIHDVIPLSRQRARKLARELSKNHQRAEVWTVVNDTHINPEIYIEGYQK